MTIQTAFRLKKALVDKLKKYCETEGRSQTWVANKAFSDYLGLTQKEPTGIVSEKKPVAKKAIAVVADIDYSIFNLTHFHLDEIQRIRTKNADSPKKAKMTQRIVNALAKEFNKAYVLGFTIDQILDEWESRGWKSFKAEWMRPDKPTTGRNTLDSTKTRDKTVQQQLSDKSWAN